MKRVRISMALDQAEHATEHDRSSSGSASSSWEMKEDVRYFLLLSHHHVTP